VLNTVLKGALLFLLCVAPLQANTLQLAYLEIESVNTSAEGACPSDGCRYEAMWKQPANIAVADALTLQFSSGVEPGKKAESQLLNGSRINFFTLVIQEGLANHSLTIGNLVNSDTEVIVKYTDGSHTASIRLTSSTPSYVFQQEPSSLQTIQSYTLFGIQHILEGYDHLLFVLCLLLIASTLKKLLWAITGFTLAHSITLILSALGWVTIPIAPVEAIIALSIVFLAVEIAKRNTQSLSYRYPVAVSSSFGLLHGFGFASVLLELGLPQNDKLLALGFFNVGVEIGQLIFISCVVAILWCIQYAIKKQWFQYKDYRLVGSYMIGATASMWLIERVMQF
jgi:hydrogenase/urease accessory protein HupE